MFNEDSDDEQESNKVDLINQATNTLLYRAIVEAEQDDTWLTLSDYPNGIFSMGFATCYAVIIKHTAKPEQIALAHVSSISIDDLAFFQNMILSISTDQQFTIELARSKQGYTDQYIEDQGRSGDPEPDVYFEVNDRDHQQFFKDNFNITPIIHEMPSSVIVIKPCGGIDFLAEHSYDSLEVVETMESTTQSCSSRFFPHKNKTSCQRITSLFNHFQHTLSAIGLSNSKVRAQPTFP